MSFHYQSAETLEVKLHGLWQLWESRLPRLTPVTKAANPKEQVVPYVGEE